MNSLKLVVPTAKTLVGVALMQSIQSWAQEAAPVAMKIASGASNQLIRDPPGWPLIWIALLAFLAFLAFASVCVVALIARASRADRELQQQLSASIAELNRRGTKGD